LVQKNYSTVYDITSSKKEGLVCIIDALGIKQITDDEKLSEFMKQWFNLMSLSKWSILHNDTTNMKFYNFSDTIAITVDGNNFERQISDLYFLT